MRLDSRPPLPDRLNPLRPPLDHERVARALTYTVTPLEETHFCVSRGGARAYVTADPYFDCDCGDFTFRGQGLKALHQGEEDRPPVICKHLAAVLLYLGDPEACALAAEVRAAQASEAPGADVPRARRNRRPAVSAA